MFKTFDEIIAAVKKRQKKQKVAIVGAEKHVSVETALDMIRDNLAIPVLFGVKEKIKKIIQELSPETEIEIVDTPDDERSAHAAVDLAAEGKIDLILKGNVPTATLLKAVLRKENGLKQYSVLNDVFIFEDPLREKNDKRLIGLTDGGLIPLPDLETKVEMMKSATEVFHKLGFSRPKVAFISAVETPTEKIPSTMEAAEIKKRFRDGLITIEAEVDGPFAIDNVISEYAAKIKGIESSMAGCADILIAPNIETGNVLGKLAAYYGKAENGHVILGAKIPILITSRADDAKTKLNSVALGILVSF